MTCDGIVVETQTPPVSATGPLTARQLRDLAALNEILARGDGVLRVARLATAGIGRSLVFLRLSPAVEETVLSDPSVAERLRREGSALLTDLVVADAHRRRGVGTILVRDACRIARESGLRRLTLEVRADNEAARGLYERLGFTPETDGEVIRYSVELRSP